MLNHLYIWNFGEQSIKMYVLGPQKGIIALINHYIV